MMPMSFSTTIPLRTATEISDTWRLVISLAIALGLHAALIAIPVSLAPLARDAAAGNKSALQIIMVNHKKTGPAPNSGQSSAQAAPRKLEAQGKSTPKPEPPSTAGTSPATPEKLSELERRSTERSSQPGTAPPPAPSEPGAESQSESTPKSETYSSVETWLMGIPADSAGAKVNPRFSIRN